jgi:hypothetical protein
MNLKGSLTKLQKSGGQFYLNLAQLFESNQLISDTWVALAKDMDQQAASMDSLPVSFWKKIGIQETEALVQSIHSFKFPPMAECALNRTINGCFGRTLDVAEPLILKAYVPIIRHLRSEFSDQALELYIMVKAHVARIDRVFQQYAGDPVLLKRVHALHEIFEHEVQVPAAPPPAIKAVALPAPAPRSASSKVDAKPEKEIKSVRPAQATVKKEVKPKTAKKSEKATQPLGQGVKHQPGSGQAISTKLELPRRRAQR